MIIEYPPLIAIRFKINCPSHGRLPFSEPPIRVKTSRPHPPCPQTPRARPNMDRIGPDPPVSPDRSHLDGSLLEEHQCDIDFGSQGV